MRAPSDGRAGSLAPPLARRVLAAILPSADRAHVLADLDELFAVHCERDGPARARRWYLRQSVEFGLRLSVDRMRRTIRVRHPRAERPAAARSPSRSGIAWAATDARLAWRALVRRPAYSATAALTLGIGIAAVTTVFSIANWVLLRPVPGVAAPAELATVQLESTDGGAMWWPISNPDYVELGERLASVALAAYTAQDVHFAGTARGAPVRIPGEVVTANFFMTLGVRMAAGHAFAPADAHDAATSHVAVVSHALWRRYWNESPSAVGAGIVLNGRRFVVVGVAPRGFHGAELPGRAQIWVPGGALPSLLHDPGILTQRGRQVWSVLVARARAPGAAPAIEAALNQGVSAIRATYRDHSFLATHLTFRAYAGIGLPPLTRDRMADALGLLAAAAAILLLLTCANVANLGLVRSLSLRTSVAVRRALGAGLARLVGERLLESTMLGLAGAAVAVGLSAAALGLVRGSGLGGVGLELGWSTIDARVAAAAVAAALMSGLLAGTLPAASMRREDGATLLRSARHGDRRATRTRHALVVAQVALSTVLVFGAGLLARTLWNLRHVELGFPTANVLTFSLDPQLQGYDEGRSAALIDGLLAKLQADPRIASAAVVDFPPFGRFYIPAVMPRPGARPDGDDANVVARNFRVSPAFFDALGLRLYGDGFATTQWLRRDSVAGPVAVLSQQAARALFPGVPDEAVIGRTFTTRARRHEPVRVVGVVRDARLSRVTQTPEPYVFRPWSQGYYVGRVTIYARTTVRPSRLVPFVTQAVRDLDPTLPVYGVRTLRDDIDAQIADQRLLASLAGSLGVIAVLLAALGLYALLAYAVVERRREIGIRAALGALPRTILTAVLRGGLRLAASGLVLGLIGAAYASRFLEARLYGVHRFDPVTYGAAAALLLGIAGVASGVPARRATRVDVVEVLRDE